MTDERLTLEAATAELPTDQRACVAPAVATVGRDLSPLMACLTLAVIAVVMLDGPVSTAFAAKHD